MQKAGNSLKGRKQGIQKSKEKKIRETDWTTGGPSMEMNGGSTASYLMRALCVPVFFLVLTGLEAKGFRLLGTRRDHFRFTVEPLPSHIRCRIKRYSIHEMVF